MRCVILIAFLIIPSLFAQLSLKDGDTVAFVGGTFVEREANDSYIETALTLASPGKKITFRNFGWAGDTVKGESRGYFNPDGYKDLIKRVTEVKPTVILLAYGGNAAWSGPEGIAQFKKDYEKLVTDLHDKTKARFILLTPLMQENLGTPYPDPSDYNKNAALYSTAVKEIASSRKFPVIDLHSKFPLAGRKYTTNSLHLTPEGYSEVAKVIGSEFGLQLNSSNISIDGSSSQGIPVAGLKSSAESVEFKVSGKKRTMPESVGKGSDTLKVKGLKDGKYTVTVNGMKLFDASSSDLQRGVKYSGYQGESLRRAIAAKNELFFHAWRPQNTTYLFFFRKHEQGQNAKDIPEIFKHLNEREAKLEALQKPQELIYKIGPYQQEKPAKEEKIDFSYVQPAEKELKTFQVPDDLEISLFAAEPMVVNPTNMNWDSKGRLWVCSAPTYPHIPPGDLANDRIVVLEDTDKDGKADKSTVFVDGLLIPTAVIPGNGGVYVANSTELIHYKDLDGDLKADTKEIVLSGFGTEDTHHILHTPRWGQDGLLYMNQSIYIHSHIETPFGVKRLMAGGIWQFDPRNGKLEILNYGLVNSWGHIMDKWGQSFATDGAGGHGINFIFPGHAGVTAYRNKHIMKGMNPGQPKHCGLELITGTHFPEKYRGFLVCNDFRGHRTNMFKVSDSGSGYVSKQQVDLVGTAHRGTDRLGKGGAYRPIDVKMGPDGALYLADWSNIIIQHGEVDFRDKRRDHKHGRIWRVSAKNRPLIKQPPIAGAKVTDLLKNLSSSERWTVDMSKRELIERGSSAVVGELDKWTGSLPAGAEGDYFRLQALWIKQGMGVADEKRTKELLKSNDEKIRAAAVRVLRHFHDQINDVDSLLLTAIKDDYPRVRLEAVNALRKRKTVTAAETAVLVLDKDMDSVLEYALTLTLRKLQPYWSGKTSFKGKIPHISYAVKATGNTDPLQTMLKAYKEGNVSKELQAVVLSTVAQLGGKKETAELFSMVVSGKLQKDSILAVLQEMNKRKNRPGINLSDLKKLLTSEDSGIRNQAVLLVGSWKAGQLAGEVNKMAQAGDMSQRLAAVQALAELKNAKALTGLISNADDIKIKMAALAGFAGVNAKEAAKLAPTLLSSIDVKTDSAPLFDAFIRQKNGAGELNKALAGKKIPSHVAAAGVRQCSVSGQKLDWFAKTLTKAGDLKPMKQILSAQEMKAMVAEVNGKGNPHIGEQVYRRKALLCVNCHAIGGAGPEIGPDLISIGASAPVDYIIESLLQPAKKIKEGYHMTMITTKDGKLLSGAEVSADNKEVVIRDPAGNKTVIPASNIKKKQIVPMSMMPPGLTAQLSKEEFIHLVSFLSKLGKAGDFNLPKGDFVRNIKYVSMEGQTVKDFFGRKPEFFKNSGLNWMPGLAKVNGFLPISDGSIFSKKPQIIKFSIDVKKQGKIAFKFSQSTGLNLKGPEGGFFRIVEDGSSIEEFSKGVHTLYLMIRPEFTATELRIELVEAKDSPGTAVLVK